MGVEKYNQLAQLGLFFESAGVIEKRLLHCILVIGENIVPIILMLVVKT